MSHSQRQKRERELVYVTTVESSVTDYEGGLHNFHLSAHEAGQEQQLRTSVPFEGWE